MTRLPFRVLAFASGTLFCLTAAAVQIPFGANEQVSTNATGIRSLTAADVNGDGHMDLVGTSESDDEVSWYENDGASPPAFTQRHVSTAPTIAVSVAATDMDQDGDIDLVTASRFDNTIAWHENDGSALPLWTHRVISATAVDARGVSVADVDGDGDPDVLSASSGDNRIAWYENDGAAVPGFTTRTLSANAAGARDARAADLDGDGDLDVVSASSADNRIAWYENNGASPPAWTARTISATIGSAFAVAVTDLDRNGTEDVISVAFTGDRITWHANDGTPGNGGWISTPVATNLDGVCFAIVADLDLDGDIDIVSASLEDDFVQWHENDGQVPPSFTTREVAPNVDGACAVTAADLDGDGDYDVATGALLGNELRWIENATIHRNAQFPQPFDVFEAFGGGIGGRFTAFGDLDGDGTVDIVAVDRGSSPLAYLRNTGIEGLPFLSTPLPLDDDVDLLGLRLADIDGDMDLDLYVIQEVNFSPALAWLENDGAAEPSFVLHSIPSSLDGRFAFGSVFDVGDLDGDGDPDVVFGAGANNDNEPFKLLWQENDGAQPPGFTEHIIPTTGSFSFEGLAIDFIDADTNLDVFATTWTGPIWFLNDGATPVPGFTQQSIPATSFVPDHELVSGDLDGDGDMDFASPADPDGAVVWYENHSTNVPPTFTEQLIATHVPFIEELDIADIDGDTHLDVVIFGRANSDFSWFENDGAMDPQFTQQLFSPTLITSAGLLVFDLDEDTDLDVVFLGRTAFGVVDYELLLHDGANDPSFDSVIAVSPIQGVETARIGDIDDDGDPDVLTAGDDTNVLAWHENTGGALPGYSFHFIARLPDSLRFATPADLDGDGDLDVVTGARDTNTDSYVWFEQGAGPDDWTERQIPYDSEGVIFDVMDFDRDGDLDVIGGTSFDISWHENDGSHPPTFTERLIAFEPFPIVGTPVDLDRDGDLDVPAGGQFNAEFYWYENDGSTPPAFVATNAIPTATGPGGPRGLVNGDFDGDGDIDLIGLAGNDFNLEMFENDGLQPPTFTPRLLLPALGRWSIPTAGDVDQDGDPDIVAGDISGDVTYWLENDGQGTPNFTRHDLPFMNAEDYLLADGDQDGDLDALLAVRADGRVAWLLNRGGQVLFQTEDLADAALLEGAGGAQLGIEAIHAGRPGDAAAEWVALELLFEETPDDPLTTAEANGIIDAVSVVLDTGSGVYEPGLDPLVASVTTLSLTDGVQQIAFVDDDTDVQLDQGAPRTYFVVVSIAMGANAQDPHAFQVTHVTESSSRVQHRALNLPLTTAATANRGTRGTLAMTPTSDEDGDQMPDAWENDNFGDPVVTSPFDNDDGDGATNREEYIADTDPNSTSSVFRVLMLQPGSGIGVSYLSSAIREYTLQFTDSLMTGSWSAVSGQAHIPGNSDMQTLTDSTETTGRIYRVRAQLP